jgi:chromosome transmission fidelity protein 1
MKVIPLGSRSTHCTNPEVSKLTSATLMNDRCQALREKKGKDELSSCSQYKSQKNQDILRDHALASVGDIEDLLRKGRELCACPYYASRAAVPSAELVTLPYNLLLHKEMRESLGISLEGNIVVIDEAHNMLDSINSMYSVLLSGDCMQQAQTQLSLYHDRYQTKLNPANLKNVTTLLSILEKFLAYLDSFSNASGVSAVDLEDIEDNATQKRICSLTDFSFASGIDDVNLFQLESFIEKSEIAKKVQGFARFHQLDGEGEVLTSAMSTFRSFLQALTHPEEDGRVVIELNCTFVIPQNIILTITSKSVQKLFVFCPAESRATL